MTSKFSEIGPGQNLLPTIKDADYAETIKDADYADILFIGGKKH